MRLIGSYSRYHIDKNITYSIYALLIFLNSEKKIFINGCMFNIWILLNKREMENKTFLCNIIWFVSEYVPSKPFDTYEGLNPILIIAPSAGFVAVLSILVVVLFVILRYTISMHFYELQNVIHLFVVFKTNGVLLLCVTYKWLTFTVICQQDAENFAKEKMPWATKR